jgi:hypothetical protein
MSMALRHAAELAEEAYVFGYPLVLMDAVRRVMTATSRAGPERAPVNQLRHTRAFTAPGSRAAVRPNPDALCTSAWLNLVEQPMVIEVPDTGQRYHLMQMHDAWTNVFGAPGTRTTGNGAATFVISGAHWDSEPMPEGLEHVAAPTNMVLISSRTQTNGPADYQAVHEIQHRFSLVPWNAVGRQYLAPDDVPLELDVDAITPPALQVARMTAGEFFARLNVLMQDNPPAAEDAPLLKRQATIGVVPGKAFDLARFNSALVAPFERSVLGAQARIESHARKSAVRRVNGWRIPKKTGRYGTDYLQRAAMALSCLGAGLPEDMLMPHTASDSHGQPLTGRHRYQIRFAKGELPPVNAFWSLALYDSQFAFVANSLDRHAIGDRGPLHFAADGSLTVPIQHLAPTGDEKRCWLPAPRDEFNLTMRLYWPTRAAIDGQWKPPPVQRVS